jgi:hypothetical protein
MHETIPNSSIYSVIDASLQAIGEDHMRTASKRAFLSALCVVVIAAVVLVVIVTFDKTQYRNAQYGFYVSLPSTWKGGE